jgi:hypothetical protein
MALPDISLMESPVRWLEAFPLADKVFLFHDVGDYSASDQSA